MKIEKNGIINFVNEALFKKSYEPLGWKIADEQKKETAEEKVVKELKTEEKIKNYKNMKSKLTKSFNDGIIKEEK